MIDDEMREAAARLLDAGRAAGATIVTAESCTGGMIGGVLTAIPGSSDVYEGGFVTYANTAKVRLGVPKDMLKAHGAVSEPVARAMAEAARARSGGGTRLFAVAVTGVAGPGGGTADKPVGLVHFAGASADKTLHRERRFGDVGRDEVRAATVLEALDLLRELLSSNT